MAAGGGVGVLGSPLRVRLGQRGHEVARLVRGARDRDGVPLGPGRGPRSTATAFDGRRRGGQPGRGRLVAPALDHRAAGVDPVLRVDSTGTLRHRSPAGRPAGPAADLRAPRAAATTADRAADPHTEDSPAGPATSPPRSAVQWEARPSRRRRPAYAVVSCAPPGDGLRSGSAFLLVQLAWSCGLGATLGDGRPADADDQPDGLAGAVQWAPTPPRTPRRRTTSPFPSRPPTPSSATPWPERCTGRGSSPVPASCCAGRAGRARRPNAGRPVRRATAADRRTGSLRRARRDQHDRRSCVRVGQRTATPAEAWPAAHSEVIVPRRLTHGPIGATGHPLITNPPNRPGRPAPVRTGPRGSRRAAITLTRTGQ